MTKKVSCIVKINSNQFVKYEYVNNLKLFTIFIDKKFPDWRYFNVFNRETKQQIGSFTKNNKPQKAIIS